MEDHFVYSPAIHSSVAKTINDIEELLTYRKELAARIEEKIEMYKSHS